LKTESADMEEGYPGKLNIEVKYLVPEDENKILI
jgi:hypothetical protein